MRGRVRRTGFGIVLVVIVLFFIMALPLCLMRHVQASQTSGQTRSAALGGIALDLGRSALTEALRDLETRVNDPSAPLFKAVRAPDGMVRPFGIPVGVVGRLAAADPLLCSFEVVGGTVEARMLVREPLAHTDYETRSVFRLTVTVRHRLTGLVRTLSEDRSMRVALLSPPRPYDQFTVVVLRANALVGPDVNAWLGASRDVLALLSRQDKPSISRKVKAGIDFVNEQMELANQQLPPGEDKLVPFDAREFLSIIEPAAVPEAPAIGNSVTDPLHLVPDRYSIATKADRVDDLSSLYLVPDLARSQDAISAARAEYQKGWARLDDTLRRIDQLARARPESRQAKDKLRADAEALKGELRSSLVEVRRTLEAMASTHLGLLQAVRTYESRFIETGGKATDWLASFEYKTELAEWARRAFVRFEGPGAVGRFAAFLDRYQRESPPRPVNGVVFLNNGKERLTLANRTLRGKLVVVATGAVEIRDVRVADRSNDLLVVQCQGTLAAAGRVDAALIPRGPFLPEAGVEIAGPVVFGDVKRPDRLCGRVIRDGGRYYSGVAGSEKLEYQYAAFSPWSTSTQIRCD